MTDVRAGQKELETHLQLLQKDKGQFISKHILYLISIM